METGNPQSAIRNPQSTTIQCPVCPQADIPGDAARCPTCNVDLTPIHRLRELGAVHFNEALGLAEAGAADVALQRAASAVALDGQSAAARSLLGKLLWNRGQQEDAVQQWRQAQALTPHDTEIQALLDKAEKAMRRARLMRVGALAGAAIGLINLICVLFGLGAADRRLEAKDRRLEARDANFQAEIAGIKSQASDIESTVSALKPQVTSLKLQVSDLDATVAGLKPEVTSLKPQVSNLDAAISSLKSQVSGLKSQATNLESAVAGLKPQAGTPQAGDGRLATEVSGLKPQVASLLAEVSSLKTHVASLQNDAASLKPQVSSLASAVTDSRKSPAEHRKLIEALIPLLEASRPPEAAKMAEKIRQLRADAERLRGESKATVQAAEAFAAIEAGLAELQRDYDARFGRWDQALERLKQQMNDGR